VRSNPPPMKKVYPRDVDPVTDWDFNGTWTLDPTIYVSDPSALKWKIYNNQWACYVKNSACPNISQGKIVSYFRANLAGGSSPYDMITYAFRANNPDGSATPSNLYCIELQRYPINSVYYLAKANLFYGSYGGKTKIDTRNLNPVLEEKTWHRLTVTFWVYQSVLFVRLEKDGVKLCDDFSDPNNRYAGNSIQKCGVGPSQGAGSDYCWHDDVQLWSV